MVTKVREAFPEKYPFFWAMAKKRALGQIGGTHLPKLILKFWKNERVAQIRVQGAVGLPKLILTPKRNYGFKG